MSTRVCTISGCPDLTTRKSGRCDRHERERRQAEDRKRGTRSQRGLDNAWLALRDRRVQEHVTANGWTCPGWNREPHAVEPGQLTGDHRIPRSVAPHLRLDPNNIDVLCHPCNSAKGATHNSTAQPVP